MPNRIARSPSAPGPIVAVQDDVAIRTERRTRCNIGRLRREVSSVRLRMCGARDDHYLHEPSPTHDHDDEEFERKLI